MRDALKITIDTKEIMKTELKLGPYYKKAPLVIVRSLNRALTTAGKTASNIVRQRYTIKAGDVKKTFRLKKASRSLLTATLISKGEHVGLSHFQYSPKTPRPQDPPKSGLKISVTKGSSTQFKRAFVADINGLKIFEREGKSRLPINELVGPAVPQMVGGPHVRPKVEEEAAKTYHKRLDHEIKRIQEGHE
jgi:hypothetical protein